MNSFKKSTETQRVRKKAGTKQKKKDKIFKNSNDKGIMEGSKNFMKGI